jgi:hypothetical protein
LIIQYDKDNCKKLFEHWFIKLDIDLFIILLQSVLLLGECFSLLAKSSLLYWQLEELQTNLLNYKKKISLIFNNAFERPGLAWEI